MYLSRVLLDVDRRDTMRALASPQIVHGAVEQSFSEQGQRKIWRIDWLENQCYLLILSPTPPDLSGLSKQFGNKEYQSVTKDYSTLLKKLANNQKWQFRLCANPVRSSMSDIDNILKRGKIFAHVTTQQQKDWLMKRAIDHGFLLEENSFSVVYSQWKCFFKGGKSQQEVKLHMVTFEGVLEISDVDRFQKTLVEGIGRAKAYGCGLLTIAKSGG